MAVARNIARTHPWSQLLLRHLELVQYRALPKHSAGWIAERIGISVEEELSTLQMLETAGQVRWTGTHWTPNSLPALDLREDARSARRQRAFWAGVASARAPQANDALCAYNVCTLSAQGYAELRALQREYLLKARSLIAGSEPQERVVLLQVNLLHFEPST